MLNQERVEEMIRLAIFDQREGEACKPMIQYLSSAWDLCIRRKTL